MTYLLIIYIYCLFFLANQNCIKKLSDPSPAIIGGVVGSLVTLAVVVIVVIVVGLLIWKYRGNYCRRGNDDITLVSCI